MLSSFNPAFHLAFMFQMLTASGAEGIPENIMNPITIKCEVSSVVAAILWKFCPNLFDLIFAPKNKAIKNNAIDVLTRK